MSKEKQLTDLNVFICSTYLDLIPYRDAVIKKIKSESGVINAQEFFGARNQKPVETCLQEVEKSNVFIMFLAGRFGSTDPITNKSFVQLEYDKAKELKLPKFAYIMDEEYPYPMKFVSIGDESNHLIAFKQQVLNELTVDKFTSPDDLANKVLQDLLRELPKYGFSIGDPKIYDSNNDAVQVIKTFLALPKRFYSREFQMNVELKSFTRAPKDECSALSMEYGSTLKREFKAIDEKLADALSYNFSSLYAQNDLAEKLVIYPENSRVIATVRTVQGENSWREPIYKFEEINEDPFSQYPSIFSLTSAAAVSLFSKKRKEKVLSHYESHQELLCGLELIDITNSALKSK
jgi:hypothetical protein